MTRIPPQYAVLVAAWSSNQESQVRRTRPARRGPLRRLALLVRRDRSPAAAPVPQVLAKPSSVARTERRPTAV